MIVIYQVSLLFTKDNMLGLGLGNGGAGDGRRDFPHQNSGALPEGRYRQFHK